MRLHVLQLEAAQQGGAPLPPPGPVALPPLLSDLPLRTLRDVQEAERLLADVSVRQALKLQLLGKGSKALQRCVQILVRLLLTNDLQRNYSLAGRQKKQAFKELRMGKVLLAAVEEKTGQDSDSVEKAVGRYLAGAPARAKEAKERANRAPQDDSTDGTTVTFHFNVEPEVSEERRRRRSAAAAVKMELPDPTEVQSEAVSSELDGSSGSTAMTAVTIKTEPAEFVEEDEEPSSHLVSVGAAARKEFPLVGPLQWVPSGTKHYRRRTSSACTTGNGTTLQLGPCSQNDRTSVWGRHLGRKSGNIGSSALGPHRL